MALMVATIEPTKHKEILLQIDISFGKTMLLVAESVLFRLVDIHIWQTFSFNSDGGTWYPLQVCKFLKLKEHHIHYTFEKSIIEKERYNTLRTEPSALNTIFHVEEKEMQLKHVKQWLL